MTFCTNCGNELDERAVFCSQCGCSVNRRSAISVEEDSGGGIWLLLGVICGILIPIVGLILFCVLISKTPNRAKSVGIGMIIGIVSVVAFSLLIAIIAVALYLIILAAVFGMVGII